MKALTVQQPWAWAIIHGGKLIENRTTAWAYRGRLAIHAGARWSFRGATSGLVWDALDKLYGWPTGPRTARDDPRPGFASIRAFGAVIGTVDLVDVHPDAGCCRPWGESTYRDHHGAIRRGVVHLVLEDPQPCEPIPMPGRLGLWTWEPDQ